MATRMQQRRGTSSQWTAANPVMASGEIGFETDTNKLKIGDGVNIWANLSYFIDETNLSASLGDYVELDSIGVAGGVASLDVNGFVPANQLNIDVSGDIDAAVAALVASAPGALDTLNELAAALGNDENFSITVTNAISAQVPKSTVTTAGDLIVADGASSVTRLGVGTDDQVLSVVDGAVAWADSGGGSMTLLSTTTLTGSIINLTSIPQTYKDLRLIIRNFKHDLPASNRAVTMRFNGDGSAKYSGDSLNTFVNREFPSSAFTISPNHTTDISQGLVSILIPDYANTTTVKMADSIGIQNNNENEYGQINWNYSRLIGLYEEADEITEVNLFVYGADFDGGTALLYGVN